MLEKSEMNNQGFIAGYINGIKATADSLRHEDIQTFMDYMNEAYEQGRKVFIVGNGGSAATASHMACDLSKTVLGKGYDIPVKRFAVIALTDNMPLITAWANDVNYDFAFSQPLRNLANEDDLLIVITASGNSPNILEAVRAARSLGMKSIGMLGFDGGAVKPMLDHAVVVESSHYGYIEDAHMILTHLVTAFFKNVLETQAGAVLSGDALVQVTRGMEV